MRRRTVELVVFPLLRLIDRMLQLLLPVRDDRVCYVSIPDYTDNAYYLYRHALRTRDGLEHVWLVRDPDVVDQIQQEFNALGTGRPGKANRLRIVRKQSVTGYLLYLTSRRVFHTHGAYAFSDSARRRDVVAVWHGMPIKAIGRLNRRAQNPRPTFATASIATSQLYRPIIADAFGLARDAVEVCGLPRCDTLRYEVARGTSRCEVRRILGVPDDQRLVLWMPTYRGPAPARWKEARAVAKPRSDAVGRSFIDDLPPWAFEAIERSCVTYGCTTVIKLHPYDVLNRTDGSRHGSTRLSPEGSAHVRLVTSQQWLAHRVQLYDLVAASDALISDVSSVLIDFLVTSRPIGVLGFDEEGYDRDLLLPFDRYFGGGRFTRLDDEAALDRFFAAVGAGAEVATVHGDISNSLYEDFALPSSEAVLRRFGL